MALGYATFPGLVKIVGGTFTFSGHGTAPSSAAIDFEPTSQVLPPATRGTLEFHYGDTHILFPDCKLNMASFARGMQGRTGSVQIQDRRVWWQERTISGRYNLRKKDESVDANTERTPQQLATLLLLSLNETGFDVTALPNDTRPAVDWSYASVVQELDRLCESLGCHVVLQLNNKVKICRVGVGEDLPTLPGRMMDESGSIDPPEVPDALRVVFAETRVQVVLACEAVGRDTDNSVKRIADLSYAPTGGWGSSIVGRYLNISNTITPEAGNQTSSPRALAIATVYKWYRVYELVDANFITKINQQLGPEFHFKFERMDQLLPLLPDLIEVDPTTKRPYSPTVQGTFDARTGTWSNSAAFTKYTRGYSVNLEDGIVEFNDYVWKWTTPGSASSAWEPASIYLIACVNFQHDLTREAHRVFRRLPLGGNNGTGDKIIRVEEIGGTLRANYSATGIVTNFTSNVADLNKEADFQLNAALAEYQVEAPTDKQYEGFVPVSPDGAIFQVTFAFRVGTPCHTRASRNNDYSLAVPSYKERQRQAAVRRAAAAQANAMAAREQQRRTNTGGLGSGYRYTGRTF